MNLKRPISWGVIIIALWSLILGLLTLAGLLRFSQVVSQVSVSSESQIWILFVAYTLFTIGFGLSTYGLWQFQSWGRRLFLWTVGAWAIFGVMGLLRVNGFSIAPERTYTVTEIVVNLIRYLAGFILPLLYLNLGHIKPLFQTDTE